MTGPASYSSVTRCTDTLVVACPAASTARWTFRPYNSLWIGNHFIAADHGTRRRADVVKVVLRWLEA